MSSLDPERFHATYKTVGTIFSASGKSNHVQVLPIRFSSLTSSGLTIEDVVNMTDKFWDMYFTGQR